jgi:hypothetical protein
LGTEHVSQNAPVQWAHQRLQSEQTDSPQPWHWKMSTVVLVWWHIRHLRASSLSVARAERNEDDGKLAFCVIMRSISCPAITFLSASSAIC